MEKEGWTKQAYVHYKRAFGDGKRLESGCGNPEESFQLRGNDTTIHFNVTELLAFQRVLTEAVAGPHAIAAGAAPKMCDSGTLLVENEPPLNTRGPNQHSVTNRMLEEMAQTIASKSLFLGQVRQLVEDLLETTSGRSKEVRALKEWLQHSTPVSAPELPVSIWLQIKHDQFHLPFDRSVPARAHTATPTPEEEVILQKHGYRQVFYKPGESWE